MRGARRKGTQAASPFGGGLPSCNVYLALAIGISLTVCFAGSAAAQATYVVKLAADTAAKEYTIEPAILVVHPKDVVVFQVVSGAPHNITFEGAGLSPQARAALNAALPRRSGDLSSPLLTAPGMSSMTRHASTGGNRGLNKYLEDGDNPSAGVGLRRTDNR